MKIVLSFPSRLAGFGGSRCALDDLSPSVFQHLGVLHRAQAVTPQRERIIDLDQQGPTVGCDSEVDPISHWCLRLKRVDRGPDHFRVCMTKHVPGIEPDPDHALPVNEVPPLGNELHHLRALELHAGREMDRRLEVVKPGDDVAGERFRSNEWLDEHRFSLVGSEQIVQFPERRSPDASPAERAQSLL